MSSTRLACMGILVYRPKKAYNLSDYIKCCILFWLVKKCSYEYAVLMENYFFISYDVNEFKFTERILWIIINIFNWASYIMWITAINFSRYLQVINNERKSIANWTTISKIWVSNIELECISWRSTEHCVHIILYDSVSLGVSQWEIQTPLRKFIFPTDDLFSLTFWLFLFLYPWLD